MKKKNLKSVKLTLKKQSISNLKTNTIYGGSHSECHCPKLIDLKRIRDYPVGSFDYECNWSLGQADYDQYTKLE